MNSEDMIKLQNNVIMVNQQAQKVYDYIVMMVNNKSMAFASKNHANTLRNLATHLTRLARTTVLDFNAIENTEKQVSAQFFALKNAYLPHSWIMQYNYEPMKKIESSLAVIDMILRERKNQAEQPV